MILYLIGNGFDLAHNLPTSYSDFMQYLQDELNNILHLRNIDDKDILLKYPNKESIIIDNWIVNSFNDKDNVSNNPSGLYRAIYYKTLLEKYNKTGTWADLEQLYFELIFKNRKLEQRIKIINEEFEHLKMLLFNYLKEKVESKSVPQNESIVQHIIKNQKKDSNVQFITFNYTSNLLGDYCNLVENLYSKKTESKDNLVIDLHKETKPEIIHIHGDLQNEPKDIIFGYGDDNSEQYNELKNLLNDDLLENFKTFHYLKNSKYKDVLNLIEYLGLTSSQRLLGSSKIKVVSIGNSLSLCDKTLLKTIFTHKNVEEIEVAYHNNEKEYFKNIYNLARIIDDNELMREKVVPLSETLEIS